MKKSTPKNQDRFDVGESLKDETETILVSESNKVSPGKQNPLKTNDTGERRNRKCRKSSRKKIISSAPPTEVIDLDTQASNTDKPPPRYSLRGPQASTNSRNKTSALSNRQSECESSDMDTVVKKSVTKSNHKKCSSVNVCKVQIPQVKLYTLRSHAKASNLGQNKGAGQSNTVGRMPPKERNGYTLRRGTCRRHTLLETDSSDTDCVISAEESDCDSQVEVEFEHECVSGQATEEMPEEFTKPPTTVFLSGIPEKVTVDNATESQIDGTSSAVDTNETDLQLKEEETQSESSIQVPKERDEEPEVLFNPKDVDSEKAKEMTCQSPSKIVLVDWYLKVQANDSVTLFGFKEYVSVNDQCILYDPGLIENNI